MQLHWFYFCQELTVFGLYHISKIVECYWACFKTFFMNGIHIMRYIWGFNPLRFCLYKLFQICCSKWTYFTETWGTFSLRLCMRPQWWDYPFDNDHVTYCCPQTFHIVPVEYIHCSGIISPLFRGHFCWNSLLLPSLLWNDCMWCPTTLSAHAAICTWDLASFPASYNRDQSVWKSVDKIITSPVCIMKH